VTLSGYRFDATKRLLLLPSDRNIRGLELFNMTTKLTNVDQSIASTALKNCSLWEGLTLQMFVEDCLPWDGPQDQAGEECEESSTEEEGTAETKCDELTTIAFRCPPVPLGGRR